MIIFYIFQTLISEKLIEKNHLNFHIETHYGFKFNRKIRIVITVKHN